MVDVSGVAHEEQWWLWGHMFTNVSRGERLRAKNLKLSTMARFQAILGYWEMQGGSVRSKTPLLW